MNADRVATRIRAKLGKPSWLMFAVEDGCVVVRVRAEDRDRICLPAEYDGVPIRVVIVDAR